MAKTQKNLDNLKKGKRFSSFYQPKKNGRRKDIIKNLINSESLSSSDARAYLEFIVHEYSIADIEEKLAAGKDTLPVAVAIIMRAILTDTKKGSTDTIDKIYDRVYGKANQPVEVDTIGLSITSMTKEERVKAIEEIINKRVSERG